MIASTVHTLWAASEWAATMSPAPAGAGPRPTPSGLSVVDVALIVLGIGVAGAGAGLFVRARNLDPGATCRPPLPLLGAVRRSTLFTLAMCLLVLGYHIAAWTVPGVLGLQVPGHRGWMLGVAIVLAVLGTAWAEKMER